MAKLNLNMSGTKILNPAADFIGTLMYSRNATHIMHLRTNSYAAHNALGSYYEGIVDLIDSLAETHQGSSGVLLKISVPQCNCGDDDPLMYLKSLRTYVTSKRGVFKESFEQNIIDEILTLLNATIYKLTFLK